MNNLTDFIKNQFNRDVKIYEYQGEELRENQDLINFNNKEYIFEFIDNSITTSFNGYCYAFYQNNLDFLVLENILFNLYTDIEIKNFDNYVIITSKFELDLNNETPFIIESESYRSTFVVNLGYIKNIDSFNTRISLSNNLVAILNKTKIRNNYITLNDLFIFDYIEIINEYNNKHIDSNILNNLDKNLLNTGISFIENDLNLTKTSNALFLHRNTLLYRLEKIKETINLDLRQFKDAFIFYINVKYLHK